MAANKYVFFQLQEQLDNLQSTSKEASAKKTVAKIPGENKQAGESDVQTNG